MRFLGIFLFSMIASILPGALRAQTASELLEQGRQAYLEYDFKKAGELYSQAKKASEADDTQFNSIYTQYLRQLSHARNFIERVEKVIIIDSITVPKNDFFKYYRIPASAGTLGDLTTMPSEIDQNVDYVFTNEGEDYKLWVSPDSVGHERIVESSMLTDGSWSEPVLIDEDLGANSDAIYPFMMADGVTLYYADNGEASMGGYDIMIAKRDATDGTFLQPSNLGFPYNSPFDDYMMAIDEFNGVGWWATDRKQLEDELTVYVFVVSDVRKNYGEDEEDLVGKARIDDYMATQPENEDYEELLATIDLIDPSARTSKPEFSLQTSNKIYHFYDELPNDEAREAMKKYLEWKEELLEEEQELSKAREEYFYNANDQLAQEIAETEKVIESKRAVVEILRSEVYENLK